MRKIDPARGEVKKILSAIAAMNIDYCILHPFPDRGYLLDTDLDIYIDPKKWPEVKKILKDDEWIADANFRFVAARHFYHKIVAGFKIKLDICHGLDVFDKDVRYTFLESWGRSIDDNGFFYLDDVAGYFYLVKKAMVKGTMTSGREDDLRELWRRSLTLRQQLDGAKESDGENLTLYGEDISRKFKKIARGAVSWRHWLRAYAGRLKPAQGAITISFLGMDGAGKGTYIPVVTEHLTRQNLNWRLMYLGYGQFRMPGLNRIARLKVSLASKFIQRGLTVIYLALLPFDFLMRRGRGEYDVLVTDRHPAFEPVFDSGFLGLYNKFLELASPSPELIIYLGGDTSELWSRKRESSFMEYARRKEVLERRLMKPGCNLCIIQIDTARQIEAVSADIILEIDNYVANARVGK